MEPAKGVPMCCCCRFTTVLIFLLMQLAVTSALMLVGYIFVYRRFVYEMIVTGLAILVSIYAVLSINRGQTREVLVLGIAEIIFGIHILVKIVFFVRLYFGKDGEKILVELFYGVGDDGDEKAIEKRAAPIYALTITIAFTQATLSLIVGILCFKFRKHFKDDLPSAAPFLKALEEEYDENGPSQHPQ
ncbi:hypothetical protein Y032_0071g601 [Ancylostoma ceylanicum]|nr:hypothetical protein Y032_0071g601 [Ancylostoma ceylanicum]